MGAQVPTGWARPERDWQTQMLLRDASSAARMARFGWPRPTDRPTAAIRRIHRARREARVDRGYRCRTPLLVGDRSGIVAEIRQLIRTDDIKYSHPVLGPDKEYLQPWCRPEHEKR